MQLTGPGGAPHAVKSLFTSASGGSPGIAQPALNERQHDLYPVPYTERECTFKGQFFLRVIQKLPLRLDNIH